MPPFQIIAKTTMLACLLLLLSCSPSFEYDAAERENNLALNDIAEAYVKLALSFRVYDDAYVDAYFGPQNWSDEAEAQSISLVELEAQARLLISSLQEVEVNDIPSILSRRYDVLEKRINSMLLRMEMAEGNFLSFNDESNILFDAVAPNNSEQSFLELIANINALVPGEGDLAQRIADFKAQFIIPKARLAAVFEAAIDECRRRTLNYIELPEGEGFSVEYVTDQPWSGYNWYQGDNKSLIQINTDLPIYIERAVDLGCHEGYPGHHTYNVLVEKNLVNEREWVEYSLMPLYGPQSLISEGSANYGIDLSFPEGERQQFELQVLFPLAGFDANNDDVERYYTLLDALASLDYAGNEAARAYLDGVRSSEETIQWLSTYAMSTPERAEQRLRFFDTYRSYVINYNLGRDLVDSYINKQALGSQLEQWQAFQQLLSEPMTPEDLRAQ